MARVPPVREFPTIRRSLVFYRVFAYATGVALLLLCVEIVLKYLVGVELQAAPFGFVPRDTVRGLDLSMTIQFIHGYLYFAYLIAGFVLTTVMRYPITRFLLIAAGGVVPFLSFITENRVRREIETYLAEREAADAAKQAARVATDPA